MKLILTGNFANL